MWGDRLSISCYVLSFKLAAGFCALPRPRLGSWRGHPRAFSHRHQQRSVRLRPQELQRSAWGLCQFKCHCWLTCLQHHNADKSVVLVQTEYCTCMGCTLARPCCLAVKLHVLCRALPELRNVPVWQSSQASGHILLSFLTMHAVLTFQGSAWCI